MRKPTLAAILASCTDHIYVYDREGRYLYASTSGASALGLTPEEMIGRSWKELEMPAEIMEPFERELRSVLEGGSSLRREVAYPTVHGLLLYEYVLDPIVDGGQTVGAIAFVREVTVQRQREAEREQMLAEVVRGFVPICSRCRDIQDEAGAWVPIENYIEQRSEAVVARSTCPRCLRTGDDGDD